MRAVIASGVSRQFRDGGVRDLTFEVEAGERFAVFGDAGSGKSVLLALLAGKQQPDGGSLTVFGSPPQEARPAIGLAAQSQTEKPSATGRQLLQSALAAAHVPASQRPARIAESLHVANLYDLADRPSRELSHSARVSLRIAQSVVHKPDLILIDDLLRILPPVQRAQWWRYLDDRRQLDGTSVVHATLDSAEAESADRVMVMDGGKILCCGEPDQLLSRCHGDEIVVEAADAESVERTLRGIAQVRVVPSDDGVRFFAEDGASVAARLFRHPVAGMRSVFVRPPTLWDCLQQMRAPEHG